MSTITADDVNRMWHDDVAWSKIIYRRLRGDHVSLTASAILAPPPAGVDNYARAVRRAKRAYVAALTRSVHRS